MASKVPAKHMILDIGPNTYQKITDLLDQASTIIWNGPMGAFEVKPFDIGSTSLARYIAYLTTHKQVISVAGGGDVIATINASGLAASFSYLSTAGGAFLEWLENHRLPGTALLESNTSSY